MQSVTAICRGGICNRLKCLVSGMNISEMYGVPLYVVYPGGTRHLFTNDFEVVSEPVEAVYRSWRFYCSDGQLPKGYSLVRQEMNRWQELADYEEMDRQGCSVPYYSNEYIDFEFARVPANMRRVYLSHIHRLEPVPEVRRVVDDLIPHVAGRIGIHVRRGDTVKLPWQNGNTDEKFFEVLDKVPSDGNFFLCTDSEDVERRFIERYGHGDRVFVYVKRLRAQDESLGQQDALIDLLLLSTCRVIVGSRYSTFTEFAWWLGDCKAEVTIV